MIYHVGYDVHELINWKGDEMVVGGSSGNNHTNIFDLNYEALRKKQMGADYSYIPNVQDVA
eukprot:CAMPEP_0194256994 /NCGR_PEP_ID=MMETSP0158-20130606/38031_1 /TAXON_ID=33649 /ORGANISM="Thalassionema nitzschioides, Strain L26-B" /LENGTH=60 /DNA_ID=CAMNT_0038995897 /DNA_START=1 /DNA_END=180 /DNA_ORIENTATION=-